jgi:nitroimidazol reductase NimA-like FMN-containing flavoprotein (pyridoxamine 5'-phosphate oxidase superfamily)
MAGPLTKEEREQFLAGSHIGVLSVANTDGRPPHTVPLWYGYEPGGNVTFFTGTFGHKSKKIPLIQQAGVVSLCVQQESLPYKYVTVEGTVVQTDKPPAAEQMLKIVRRYLPEDYAKGFVDEQISFPNSELVMFTVRPDHWLSFDYSEDSG